MSLSLGLFCIKTEDRGQTADDRLQMIDDSVFEIRVSYIGSPAPCYRPKEQLSGINSKASKHSLPCCESGEQFPGINSGQAQGIKSSPSIIRDTCVFDTKIRGFYDEWMSISVYEEKD